MQTTTLANLCQRAGLSKARVARWISDKNFEMTDPPANGKARAWNLEDTVRLLAMARLVDAGCPVEVGRAIKGLLFFKYEAAYLVVIASPTIHGAELLGSGVQYDAESKTEAEILELLRSRHRYRALFIVDLEDVERQASEIMARPAIEDDEEG